MKTGPNVQCRDYAGIVSQAIAASEGVADTDPRDIRYERMRDFASRRWLYEYQRQTLWDCLSSHGQGRIQGFIVGALLMLVLHWVTA